MLVKMHNPEINGSYNATHSFHSLKVKTSLSISGDLENDINNIDNKYKVANYICGAQIIDGKVSYLDFEFIKSNHQDYYNNLANVYSKLINISETSISLYGNMTVSYDGKFYVSGISPIENVRNVVYNLISASILEDYKQRR